MFEDNRKTKNFMQAVPVMVMILVILVLIYTLVLYNNETESAKRDFMEIGSKLTGQAASGMEMWLEDQVRMTSLVASHPVIIDLCLDPLDPASRDEARLILEGLHERYPYYEVMPVALFTDTPYYVQSQSHLVRVDDGEFIIDSVGGNITGKGGYDLSYINAIAMGKDYYISEIYPSINSGEPIIAISYPIRYYDELLGAAVVAPKIDYFSSRFVESAKYGDTGYMLIVDGRGLAVSHPQAEHVMRPFEDQEPETQRIISRILSGQTYFRDVYETSDKSYYVKRVTVDTEHQPYEWYMVFTMENYEIYSNADRLLQISISLLLGGSTLIGVLLYFYTKSFDGKVRELQQLELNRQLEVEVAARTSHLAEMAVRDGLTKLYNHEATYKALGVAVNGARVSLQPLSVIMLDLDYFKALNDTYGHQFGDKVLRATSDVIRRTVRNSDIVGRYGGEEFLIILPGAPKQSAVATANRLAQELRKINLKEGVTVTASMGVTAWLGDEADELVSRVDKLLYQAKRNGRDRVESSLESDDT